jgi:hypothetical protein
MRALKFAMIASGVFFLAGIVPLVQSLVDWRHSDEIVPMFLSLYVTLGVFLLIAARDPAAHRSLIRFAAGSSFAHAGVMLIQAHTDIVARGWGAGAPGRAPPHGRGRLAAAVVPA